MARRAVARRRADPRAARGGAVPDAYAVARGLRRRQRRADRRPQPRAAERDPARPLRQRRRHPRRLRLGVPQPRHGGERAHGLPLGDLHGLRTARRPQLRRERRRPDHVGGRPDVLERRRGLGPDLRRDHPLQRSLPRQRPHDRVPVRQPPEPEPRGPVRLRGRRHRGRGRRARRRHRVDQRQPPGRLHAGVDHEVLDHGQRVGRGFRGRAGRPEPGSRPGQLVDGNRQGQQRSVWQHAHRRRAGGAHPGQHRRQLVRRPRRRRRHPRRRAGRLQIRHGDGHEQLLGHRNLRLVHQRGRRRRQDHARPPATDGLQRHLRELEPQPRRRRQHRRRPVGLRHVEAVPRPQVHGPHHRPAPRGSRPTTGTRPSQANPSWRASTPSRRARSSRPRHDHDLRRSGEHDSRQAWVCERSDDGRTSWTTVTSTLGPACSYVYVPSSTDVGKYLRARVARTSGGNAVTLHTAADVASPRRPRRRRRSPRQRRRWWAPVTVSALPTHSDRTLWRAALHRLGRHRTCTLLAPGTPSWSYAPVAADAGGYLRAFVYYSSGASTPVWTRAATGFTPSPPRTRCRSRCLQAGGGDGPADAACGRAYSPGRREGGEPLRVRDVGAAGTPTRPRS